MGQYSLTFVISLVIFATACGPMKHKPKDEVVEVSTSGFNSGFTGVVYFDSTDKYTRFDLATGEANSFLNGALNMTWPSISGSRFVTVVRSQMNPQLIIMDQYKSEMIRFSLPENPDSAPKLSPSEDLILIGGIAGDTKIYDTYGRLVANLGHNVLSYDWLIDGRIIFSRFATIYVMEKDYKSIKAFKQMKGTVRGLSVSPDGNRVALSMNDMGISHIWVVDLNTLQQYQISTSKVGEHVPSWSPDGSHILLAKGKLFIDQDILVEKGKQECMELWVVKANPTSVINLNSEDASNSLLVRQNSSGKISTTCVLSTPQWRVY